MYAVGGVYLVGAGLVFIAAATDGSFSRAQSLGLAASWPWWVSKLFFGAA